MTHANQPNILFIQADQLGAFALGCYGRAAAATPHMDRLAGEGVLFENAYSPFPLCAPSRFAMMTGRLASRIGAYDNAAELPASVPTFAHYLRARGYWTCLSGKMHFIGPDQLHGFESRLTSDIYPGDFYWTDHNKEQTAATASDDRGVLDAGVCERSAQLDYDELSMFRARQALYDAARGKTGGRPFLLTVSLIHPHDPYYCTQEYFDRHTDESAGLPAVPRSAAGRDSLAAQIIKRHKLDKDFPPETVTRARRAYFGAVSYIDDKIGELRALLDRLGLAENTVIILTSDHGEMLGERGLWYKRCHYDSSARVPFIFHAPGRWRPARRTENVSLIDLLPTLLQLAGDETLDDLVEPIEGRGLSGLIEGGGEWDNAAYAEIMSDGLAAPVFMIRRGRFKAVFGPAHSAQLFDMDSDPHETADLADTPAHAETVAALLAEGGRIWDADALQAEVEQSAARRDLVRRAHNQGEPPKWDFTAPSGEEGRWCRTGGSYNDWAFDVLK